MRAYFTCFPVGLWWQPAPVDFDPPLTSHDTKCNCIEVRTGVRTAAAFTSDRSFLISPLTQYIIVGTRQRYDFAAV